MAAGSNMLAVLLSQMSSLKIAAGKASKIVHQSIDRTLIRLTVIHYSLIFALSGIER